MSQRSSTLRADVDTAYQLQSRAAMIGAAQYTAGGVTAAAIAHRTWPLFRRQTLAFKTFLVSISTVFGLVLSAENALLAYEADKRLAENTIRKQARLDLARRGLVATETEIRKWREEREAAQAATAATNLNSAKESSSTSSSNSETSSSS